MQETIFKIQKMDCPSEEQMVRMKLQGFERIEKLDFDIPKRTLKVYHHGQKDQIQSALESLNLDTTFISTEATEIHFEAETQGKEKKLLWTVLIINVSFFALEITMGFIANSMGLVADSLDMLADGIVYGLALIAVGGTVARKKNIAKFAGYFQIVLALIGFMEVIRRFIGIEKMPDFQTMVIISIFALIANVICLYLLQKSKSKEAHMQASMIFTSNDVIINTGVISAGLLVNWLHSPYPDLIIGAVVFIIVARGAYRILQLAK
jgi:Co/Zn/Cd efflux system component